MFQSVWPITAVILVISVILGYSKNKIHVHILCLKFSYATFFVLLLIHRMGQFRFRGYLMLGTLGSTRIVAKRSQYFDCTPRQVNPLSWVLQLLLK